MARRFGWKAFVVLAALVTAGGPVAASANAAACPAGNFVLAAGNALQNAASTGSPGVFSKVAAHYTDLPAIALFALGRFRSSLPPAQRAEYIGLVKHFIGRFLAAHAHDLNMGNLRIISCSGPLVTVRNPKGGRILFRIEPKGSGYAIRDVSVESFWLAQQMRETFVGTILNHNGDIDSLLYYLKNY